MKSLKNIPLHYQIIIGLIFGVLWGFFSIYSGMDPDFTINFIKPLGTIFVNLLKMIAVPLVLTSLILGIASLNDIKKLSRIGGKTIVIYLFTTIIAITIGLVLVNLIQPGKKLPEVTRINLIEVYQNNVQSKIAVVSDIKDQPLLQPLVDMVPENIFFAMGDNTKMLQVVLFAVFFGVALIQVTGERKNSVVSFFDGFNEAILKMINYLMLMAPLGTFALIASLIVETAGRDVSNALNILSGLLWYAGTVILGLFIMTFFIYPILIKFFSSQSPKLFFKALKPVQLLAFSTSSSNATLPLTMKQCENELQIPEEITSFVLPLGATINMDGTSLYQGVAAVFIAQSLNIDLTVTDQLMILLTATLASIGSAGVPGAGMVMLVIVLESIGVPTAGIALIIAVDRILDMCRTVVNVTGDATVALIITATEKIGMTKVKVY